MASRIDSGIKIGTLAAKTGVHFETIRYYQRLGLMPIPRRSHGSVRRYGEEAARRLRFIKRAQGLGFSLNEVKLLLDLSVGEHCVETRKFAEEKKLLVDAKIADLRAIQRALARMIRACRAGRKGSGCPIIQGLSQQQTTASRERA